MTLTRILLRGVLPLLALGVGGLCGRTLGASPSERVAVAGMVPDAVTAAAPLGRLPGTETVRVTLTLPLRNQAALEDLLGRLYDPADPSYRHYLTPAQFAARFSPTDAYYSAVSAFARAQGLTVTGTHTNRLLLNVSGTARAVEAAFGVRLNRYQAADGRVFRAPEAMPSVPRALAGRLIGVAGLSDAAVRRSHAVRISAGVGLRPALAGKQIGTGPNGGLSPQDIKRAYNLNGLSLSGSGQTLAVFELDGYVASDISAYETQFGLPSVPLQNVLVDGVSNVPGAGTDEVTLDIELQIALAPGAAKVLVYEAPNTDAGVLDCYSRIAEDNSAKQISSSWGLDEQENDPSTLQAENAIFQQMAAQGQTIFAASGDSGAYDSGRRSDGLRVDDPASQPYVCGVGGTTLTTNGAGGTYASETTWNGGSVRNGGGGGGISSVWPIPSWQQSAVTSAAGSSSTMRNVPDVSLDANPNTGYAIYSQGGWTLFGGTSCAAPLWAGFTALVNQQRAANGLAPLGQANPSLYPLLAASGYASNFHDIADGSTNLFYPAVAGYDDATGLGTFNGANLLAALAPSTPASRTHVLWTHTDGTAWVWNTDAAAGTSTSQYFGPFPGWNAKAIAEGPDGHVRLLWTNADGRASLWNLADTSPAGAALLYGPYAGWTATALAVGPDSAAHLLWDNADGTVSLWNMNDANPPGSALLYGPYSGWTGKAIALGPDNHERLLWTNTDGRMSLWNLSVANPVNSALVYGPYAGWTATSLTVGTDNAARLLWDNTDGRVSLWTLTDASPAGSALVYGPYSGWSGKALAFGADGLGRLLWTNTGGPVSLWNLGSANPAGTAVVSGPYSGWSAVGFAVGL